MPVQLSLFFSKNPLGNVLRINVGNASLTLAEARQLADALRDATNIAEPRWWVEGIEWREPDDPMPRRPVHVAVG